MYNKTRYILFKSCACKLLDMYLLEGTGVYVFSKRSVWCGGSRGGGGVKWQYVHEVIIGCKCKYKKRARVESIHLVNVLGNEHANIAWRFELLVLHSLQVCGGTVLPPPTFEYCTQNGYNSLVWAISNMAWGVRQSFDCIKHPWWRVVRLDVTQHAMSWSNRKGLGVDVDGGSSCQPCCDIVHTVLHWWEAQARSKFQMSTTRTQITPTKNTVVHNLRCKHVPPRVNRNREGSRSRLQQHRVKTRKEKACARSKVEGVC